jgi:hypothetical protein
MIIFFYLFRFDPVGQGMLIEDHDVIFWFGDLNYRVDASREVSFDTDIGLF